MSHWIPPNSSYTHLSRGQELINPSTNSRCVYKYASPALIIPHGTSDVTRGHACKNIKTSTHSYICHTKPPSLASFGPPSTTIVGGNRVAAQGNCTASVSPYGYMLLRFYAGFCSPMPEVPPPPEGRHPVNQHQRLPSSHQSRAETFLPCPLPSLANSQTGEKTDIKNIYFFTTKQRHL